MAATHGTTTHLPAGPMATAPITAEEVHEYEAILRIRDQIFSGSHPRLKVPQQFVRKPGVRNAQNGTSNQQSGHSKPSGSVPGHRIMAETVLTGNAPSTVPSKPLPPPPRVAPKPTSEIDPIFLTKSDDLVRAELQLQRQRVERTLRDQLDQRKQGSKSKPVLHDLKPDLNVSEVLNRAFELVRPVSLSDPSETHGPSDSFDDNSFYSSRAPDSPPDGGPRPSSPPKAPSKPADPAFHAPIDHFTDELQRLEALNHAGSDQEMQDAYHVADQGIRYTQNQPHPGQAEAIRRLPESQQADAMEEPEYSPPAPGGPPLDLKDYGRNLAHGDGRSGYTNRNRPTQEPTSPAHNVRVVRNHITSPAAPRPSRVSPLAMAKVPSVHQARGERAVPYSGRVSSDLESGRASPNGPVSHILPRKRRKVQDRAEDTRRVSYQRPDVDLSDTYIKEEPVSPPPFADDPAVVRSRHPQERVYIDIASPQYTPEVERRERHARGPVYEVDSYHEIPVEQPTPRTLSRLSTRRPVRDDADLRRVASMQYARQAEHPRGYIDVEPRGSRAPSYAVEPPLAERGRYYEEVPAYGPRYIAVDDAYQPTYREAYYEEPSPRFMHAPQRRIVVDEHGNQYEMIPRMQPMLPPPRPVSRMPRGDVYDDHLPLRTASVRAPSVVQDPYVDRRYVPEMPPPQPIYRRVPPEYARPVASDRRSYLAPPLDGHERYAHDGSVQLTEYGPRPSYVEENVLPAERVIRTASVRPPPRRYEEVHEAAPRVGSVRPAAPGREVSVYMDERPMGDYIEGPYYTQDRRYCGGDEEAARSVPRAPRPY